MGTRLRNVISDRPKSLADVAGQPFLAHLLRSLVRQGVPEVVLGAGYLSEQIVDFVNEGLPPGIVARVVVEPVPLGTAGGIRFAAHEASVKGAFLALNGDTFFDGAVHDLWDEHVTRGATASLALAFVPDAGRYGAVRFDEDNLTVSAFEEKGVRGPGWINAGVYVLSPQALAGVPVGTPASLERDVLPALVGRGLIAVPYRGATFLDIGTPEDYERAQSVLSSGAAP
jgi:NDP-sugar pyrophosphorylase family protein